jgi:hypothetical protein
MDGHFGFKNAGRMVVMAATVTDIFSFTQYRRIAFDTGHFLKYNEVLIFYKSIAIIKHWFNFLFFVASSSSRLP